MGGKRGASLGHSPRASLPARPSSPCPIGHALQATPAIYSPYCSCRGVREGSGAVRAILTLLPAPVSSLPAQRRPLLPSAAMVKSAFGAEPASAAGNRAASPARPGRLLAPKRLHLRSGPCDCISASARELVLLKGSPVLAVEQGWTSFFCFFFFFVWLPRGDSAHPGACLSHSEDGIYYCGPHTKPVSKDRQLVPDGRLSSVPSKGEPLQFFHHVSSSNHPTYWHTKVRQQENAVKPPLTAIS